MTDQRTPTTRAGRELLRSFQEPDEPFTNLVVRLGILAIEAEARADTPPLPGHQTPGEFHDYRVACVKCGERGFLHVITAPASPAPTDTPLDGDAGQCPTCGSDACVGRLQYESCRAASPAPADTALDVERLRSALEDMVNQFASYWGGGGITTGGLSALEEAFEVLGYSDPNPAPWRGCDEPGCREEGSSGWPSPTGYRRTCHEHSEHHQRLRCNYPFDHPHFAALTPEDPR
jgi:hypothetical protein